MTKDEYQREKKRQEAADKGKKPPGPSTAEWREQQRSRESWESLAEDMRAAVHHPAHFERVFRYPDNLFGEPPELPTDSIKSAKPEDIKHEMEEREKRLRASLQAAARRDAGG